MTAANGHPLTTPAVLDRLAFDYADHDALVTPDRRFTFAELRDEVRRTAAAIAGLGVHPGDRVALWSPNTWHWVVACLATHYAGAVLVPLNTRYTAGEAADILARAAGASSGFLHSPIQRALRDIQMIRGHVIYDWDRAAQLGGKIALGFEPGLEDML